MCVNLNTFGVRVQADAETKVASLITTVRTALKHTISYRKAWLAKTRAVEVIFGNWDEAYTKLPRYMTALQTFNPGTVVDWNVLPATTSDEVVFNYVFWAFKPAIDGFAHCPPVIGIDGTFLNGKYNGKMLVATAPTGDEHILPLAFAIVDEENTTSWSWFIKKLRRHVVPNREGITLISDRHRGLLNAVARYWEHPSLGVVGYHRYCLRHVRSNFNKKFSNTKLMDLVWRAGSCHQIRKFNVIMKEIETLKPEALTWLQEMAPEKWTLAHDGGCRWGILTTNLAEGFNSVLRGARNVPITACVQTTFHRLVKYFDERRIECIKNRAAGVKYGQKVQKQIEKYQCKGNTHILRAFNR